MKKILALVLVLTMVFALAACGGGKDGPDISGKYNAVSCMVDGDAYSCEGEYISLKSNGKGTVMFMGTEYSMKWTLKGDKFTFEDEEGDSFSGVYDNGVISGNYAGMDYVFQK